MVVTARKDSITLYPTDLRDPTGFYFFQQASSNRDELRHSDSVLKAQDALEPRGDGSQNPWRGPILTQKPQEPPTMRGVSLRSRSYATVAGQLTLTICDPRSAGFARKPGVNKSLPNVSSSQ